MCRIIVRYKTYQPLVQDVPGRGIFRYMYMSDEQKNSSRQICEQIFYTFVAYANNIVKSKVMKYGVNRKVLLITAGIVWIIAGANILRIGIVTWLSDSEYWLFKIGEATIVFLLFFLFVFKKLYYKHTRRIERKKDKNCPFSFFDVKGWIVMAFMITFGIMIRSFHLFPDAFISVFYTGLSLALMFTGVLFIRYWWKNRQESSLTLPHAE